MTLFGLSAGAIQPVQANYPPFFPGGAGQMVVGIRGFGRWFERYLIVRQRPAVTIP